MSADRFNEGKPKHSLIDAEFEAELAKVLTFGAKKYAPNNWRKGLPWMETMDSLKRHINAFMDPSCSDLDEETGLHHMAHVACNAMFLVWYSKHRTEFDDRYKGVELVVGKLGTVSTSPGSMVPFDD